MGVPVRRVVTKNTREGKAVFASDDIYVPEVIPSGDAAFSLLWTTASVPADLNDQKDGRERPSGTTLHGGSVIRVVDMLPGAQSPFHRSSSIDYGIVISGQIQLELDNHEVKTIYPGEVIVQQGTIHLWRNPSSTDVCRIIFVLIEARPFQVDGEPLPDEMKH